MSTNAIGEFQIGISQVGDVPAFDWRATFISQYANSPVILALIESFFDSIDQTQNMDEFFDFIWNVDTAQGYGLDVWGRIVGVSRVLALPTGEYFGFEEAASANAKGFNQAPFYAGVQFTTNFSLSDTDYRVLVLAKAFANLTDGSIPNINQLLINLFPNQRNAYVTDGLNMTMTYTFEFDLTAVQLAIVTSSGVLPKPTGVSATVVTP